jgi:hypothetical protein
MPFSMAALVLSTFWEAVLPSRGGITGVIVFVLMLVGGVGFVIRVLKSTPSFQKAILK